MTSTWRLLTIGAFAPLLTACGDDPSEPEPDFLRPTVNGTAWESHVAGLGTGVLRVGPGRYSITGVHTGVGGITLIFRLFTIPGPGTYPLVTASRMQGSFTATLGATGGGATGTLAVSGSFDMGRT